jgi:hypothetical protein
MEARMALRRCCFSVLVSCSLKVLAYSGLVCASSRCAASRSCAWAKEAKGLRRPQLCCHKH